MFLFTIRGFPHGLTGSNTCRSVSLIVPVVVLAIRLKYFRVGFGSEVTGRRYHQLHAFLHCSQFLQYLLGFFQLRVSSVITNSPYILVLDCDMCSNDPSSTRQAMCFHLDSKLSPYLAFVQFPQEFYNVSKNDIYCAELRQAFKVKIYCAELQQPILFLFGVVLPMIFGL